MVKSAPRRQQPKEVGDNQSVAPASEVDVVAKKPGSRKKKPKKTLNDSSPAADVPVPVSTPEKKKNSRKRRTKKNSKVTTEVPNFQTHTLPSPGNSIPIPRAAKEASRQKEVKPGEQAEIAQLFTVDFLRRYMEGHIKQNRSPPSKTKLRKLPEQLSSFICMHCHATEHITHSCATRRELVDHLFDNEHKFGGLSDIKANAVAYINAELNTSITDFKDLHNEFTRMSPDGKDEYIKALYLVLCQIRLADANIEGEGATLNDNGEVVEGRKVSRKRKRKAKKSSENVAKSEMKLKEGTFATTSI